MKLAKEHPADARKLAESWHSRGGAHPAEHCLAVALIGLKQYKEAADRLEKLAQSMVHAPAPLRADVLDQAAQAWLLANEPARAYAAEGAALGLHPGDPELLVDRAEAAGSAGWFDRAIADLDQVLKTAPKRVDALIYRASAYRAQGRLDPALTDIDAALKEAPEFGAGLAGARRRSDPARRSRPRRDSDPGGGAGTRRRGREGRQGEHRAPRCPGYRGHFRQSPAAPRPRAPAGAPVGTPGGAH